MPDRMSEAQRVLLRHFGYADFRPAQHRVLRSIFEGCDTLGVMPTGGGKSVCFQVPAMVLGGLTVVISPLVSLMQDQVDAANARGIPAASLNSTMREADQTAVREAVRAGSLRLLYVSPERLEKLAPELKAREIRPSLLVVDEAHCLAEWGHDFRPSYRKLGLARYRLGKPQVIALTGSATPEVRDDITRSLGFRPGAAVHLASFDRPNLWFAAVRVRTERERLQKLLDLLRGDDRMAIVYAPTRNTCESIARALVDAGHRATPYHAGLSTARRRTGLEDFLADRVDIVVATCAFGMGIDKPTVRLVVHWTPPPTLESYYQEAGRAGRDGEFSRCVLLWRDGDTELHRRQLEVTFPPVRLLERIWASPMGRDGVPQNVLDSAERLRRELHPERGPVDWRPVRLRRKRAEARIEAVERYAQGKRCRRAALVGYFGETLRRCAGCDHCGRQAPRRPPDPAVAARVERLRQALAGKSPWGGCPLEPPVLLRLAQSPPADPAALADVPGVGAALAERLGGAILAALGTAENGRGYSGAEAGNNWDIGPLVEWRARIAREMGVPPFVILRDATLRAIAEARPADRAALARVPGIGPRTLAKFADDLVRLARS